MPTSDDAASRLRRVGEALYGERWQTPVARDLGLSDARRVRQWMAGERPIPPGIWPELADILRTRGQAAIDLADELEAVS